MPPPSLLTRTIVADRPWSFAATSALRSWRNDTSPTTSATGPPAAAAEPRAVETTPSMPLAPRFERTVMARSRRRQPAVHVADGHASCRPTGCAPSGSAAASTGNGAPSNGSSSAASHASIASRRAGPPPASRRPIRRRASAGRAVASRAARRVAVAAASAWTNVAGTSADSRQPASPSITISSGLVRASSSAIGFEVGIAPVRMTSRGRCASIQGP